MGLRIKGMYFSECMNGLKVSIVICSFECFLPVPCSILERIVHTLNEVIVLF